MWECGFDSHSSPEIFFQGKKSRDLHTSAIVMILDLMPRTDSRIVHFPQVSDRERSKPPRSAIYRPTPHHPDPSAAIGRSLPLNAANIRAIPLNSARCRWMPKGAAGARSIPHGACGTALFRSEMVLLGHDTLAYTFRPDNLRDRVNVPARANVPPSKMRYYTSQSELFSITGF